MLVLGLDRIHVLCQLNIKGRKRATGSRGEISKHTNRKSVEERFVMEGRKHTADTQRKAPPPLLTSPTMH